MKTTLAIPNCNGAQNIEAIIPRVFEENFDASYVLDDCSNDNSLELLKSFESKINQIDTEIKTLLMSGAKLVARKMVGPDAITRNASIS